MLDVSKDIHSLTEFKRNTPNFLAELKKTGRAFVLTINGKAELVAMSAETFQKVLDRLDRLDALEKLREGLRQVERGESISLEEFDKKMRRKHGLQG